MWAGLVLVLVGFGDAYLVLTRQRRLRRREALIAKLAQIVREYKGYNATPSNVSSRDEDHDKRQGGFHRARAS